MGEAVRRLHADLARGRFHIPRDEAARGYFGPGTRQAVIQFQSDAGLSLTGVADPHTVSALAFKMDLEVVAAEPSQEGESLPEEAVNATCPWSGKPVHPEALLRHQDRMVGFCTPAHRDRFALAVAHFAQQQALPLERKTCPWSGKRVRPNATLVYNGETVGFCSPAHRDQFQAALDQFAAPGTIATPVASGADSMAPMEEVGDTTYVPPLVDETALAQFCQAIQTYADGQSLHDVAAAKLALLQLQLANLRNMASLARLALIGHPLAFARFEDELLCLGAQFPCENLEADGEAGECCEGSSDEVVLLAAAVDLFAGATFLWKDDLARRDRTILAVVRAIEEAVAFPATFTAAAAVFLGVDNPDLSPAYAALVIANATQRLLASEHVCAPRGPADVRRRLEGLASDWMEANPVTAFFEAIEGPKIHRIVRWQAEKSEERDPLRIGDTITVLVHQSCDLENHGVMFTPRQPAPDAIVVDAGYQVRVPQQSRTGPVIVVRTTPDFDCVSQLLARYQQRFPDEINASVFALARIDAWAFPIAYRHPCVWISAPPASATATVFTAAGPLADGQAVSVGQTVSIQYRVEPAGADAGMPPTITAQGGSVTRTGRPDVLLFSPSGPGPASVELTWGSTTLNVPITVAPGEAG
jgi:peptidoglycan hydrolase-like protein with peptidoglycan-binding domain